MKRPLRKAPHRTLFMLVNYLCMVATLFLFSHATPAAGQSWQVAFRQTIEQGKSERATLGFETTCSAPVIYKVQSTSEFIRIAPSDSLITVTRGTKKVIGLVFDAGTLEPGVYWGAVNTICDNCASMTTCKQTAQSEYVAEITVIKRATSKPGETSTARDSAAGAFTLVAERFERAVKNLRATTGITIPGGERVEGYDAEKVKRILRDTKDDLLNQLKGKDQDGLSNFVTRKFPLAVATVRVKTDGETAPSGSNNFLSPSTLSHSIREPRSEKSLVPLKSAETAFNNVRSFISMVAASSGTITLNVISEPDGANIVLRSPGGKEYVTSTNSPIKGFARGTYNIRVRKSGFLDIVQPEQDVGFYGVTTVVCKLVPSGQGGEAQYCQLK